MLTLYYNITLMRFRATFVAENEIYNY